MKNFYFCKMSGWLSCFAAILVITLTSAFYSNAQNVSTYSFSQGSTTYTAVSGTTVFGPGGYYDDNVSGTISLPFTFSYHGTGFSSLTIAGNGEIYLGYTGYCCNYSGPFYYNYYGYASNPNTIAAMGYDLLGNSGSNKVEYATVGTAPNREFVVQWTDWGFYYTGYNEMDFQIRLREADGSIQFVYGGINPQYGGYPQVGLIGGSISDYQILTNSWSSPVPSTTEGYNYLGFYSGSTPSNGTTYTWTQPAPCAGTPATATISGPANACPTQNFSLTSTGYSSGSGLTYNWQVSTASAAGPWSSTGQTGSGSATVSQTVASWYRQVTTCTNGGATSTSNVISVGMNGFLNCYCASSSAYGAYNEIGQVKIGTCSPAFANPAVTPTTLEYTYNFPAGYTDYTGVAAPQLATGATYPFSATQTDYYNTNTAAGMGVWIDFDHSGTFTAGEMVFSQNNPGYATANGYNGTITVPGGALLGTTRMRVVLNYYGAYYGEEPCNNLDGFGDPTAPDYYYYGETEDYYVNIITGAACSGTPTSPGTATASVSLACPGTSIDLNVSNPPCALTGLVIQWQNSTDGGGTWGNIAGANLASYTVSGQSQTTQYRLRVTCTSSGLSSLSSVVTVTQDVVTNCYCNTNMYVVGPIDGGGDYLNSIDLNGFSNLTGPNAPAPDYWIYTPSPVMTNLDKGSTYTATMSITPNYPEYVRIWIDYNQNGLFESATESLGDIGIGAGGTGSITFTVPNTALVGNTRIRFRCTYATFDQDPCLQYYYGETEDYIVNITQLADCAGAPAAGTTNSNIPNPVCSGDPFVLSVSGSSVGTSGQIYTQWQSAPAAGGPWTNIAGAAGGTYSDALLGTQTVYYRRVDSCGISNLVATSSAKQITTGPCYCVPANVAPGTSTGFYLAEVNLEGTTLDNVTTGSSSPYYTYFNSPSGLVQQGEYYWMSLTSGPNASTEYAGLWFDWNSDGDFNDFVGGVSETIVNYQFPIAGGGATNHVLVHVPSTATLGTTRMRVRVQDDKFTVVDPCATFYDNGETEDYDIQIAPSSCITPSQAALITSVNPNITVNGDAITFTTIGGVGTLIGIQYSTVSPTGPWSPTLVSVYPGDPIYTQVNGANFVYLRGIYKSGGCTPDTSNVQFVKIKCHQNISAVGPSFDNDFISLVQIGTGGSLLNHASTFDATQDAYQDFKSLPPANLDFATSYPVTLNSGSASGGGYPEYMKIWIDINGDDVFQTSECVFGGSPISGQQTSYIGPGSLYSTSGTMNIPCGATATSGPVTMRVAASYNSWSSNDPCASSTFYGEVEEYTVFLNPVPSLTVTPSNAVCIGLYNTLTVTGGGSGPGQPNYTWLPVSGLNVATGSTVIATTDGIPVFYTVTGILANGCVSSDIVAVASTPQGGTVTPLNKVVCSGSSQVFTVTAAAGDIQWQTSTDGITWVNAGAPDAPTTFTLTGITSTTYVRALAKTLSCWDVASTAGVANVSATPTITFTNVTSTSVTINWTPAGVGDWTINWSGAGTGTQANPNNPFTLIGLTPNTNLAVTISKTSLPSCPGTSAANATVKTLCAPPPTVTAAVSDTTYGVQVHHGLVFSWGAVTGATAYVLQYRPLTSNANWTSVTVTGATTKTVRPLLAGVPYAYRVAANNCTANAAQGDFSSVAYAYTSPGGGACTPTPIVTAVSSCPNQITVNISNGGGPWKVTLRRLTPSYTAGVIYTTSTATTNFNIGAYANSTWEVFASAVCGAVLSPISNLANVNVKAPCPAPTNVLLSHPTCTGFTVAWNTPASLTACAGIPITGYYVYIKKTTQTAYTAYAAGLADHKTFPFPNLMSNQSYDVFVRSIACNGAVSANSDVFQFTPSGPGCRSEEMVEEVRNALGDDNESVVLYPNPSTGAFTVDVARTDATEAIVKIEVVNALGQVLQTNFSTMSGGNANEYVQVSDNISSGVYMVRVSVNDNTYTQRLVIQKD